MSTATRKNILVLVPNGITYRNLFQTGVLETIKKNTNFNLIFSINPQLGDHHGQAIPMECEASARWYARLIMSVLRKRFQTISPTCTTNILQREPLSPGFRFSVSKMGRYPFPRSIRLFNFLQWLYKKSILRNNKHARWAFDNYKIDVVLSCHPTSSEEVDYTFEALRRGIPLVSLVKSFDNLTSIGYMPVIPDALAVWNKKMYFEALDLYPLNATQVRVVGAPQLNSQYHRSEREIKNFRSELKMESGGRLLLYATVARALNPWDKEIVELLVEKLLTVQDRLLVRLHQNDDIDRWKDLTADPRILLFDPSKEKKSNLRVRDDKFLDCLKLQIAASDVVINTCSTMTLDAFEQRTPVVNIAFDLDDRSRNNISRYYKFSHYKYLLASRNIRVAFSFNELVAILNRQSSYDWKEEESFRRAVLGPENTADLLNALLTDVAKWS